MQFVKTPQLIQSFFPNFVWKMPNPGKVLFLTFDDGPIPEVTPWVLDLLDQYEAKATFFCVGDNVKKYPDVFAEVKKRGHSVGGHTYNHLNGWATDNIPYFHNVRQCAHLVKSDLFRPPYGRLTPVQAQFLQRHYRIIMWDVLSRDYDAHLSSDQVFQNVAQHAQAGSIVVFHDSLKAEKNLREVLPRVLEHFSVQGFGFERIEPSRLVLRKRA